ncbi:HAD family hydrolase [Pontivivens insulae]|uniref:Phosphoglycolate phosphatase n=1 Tax=Pontivivens insulae TaxID=1639689 RepID=A0A2R8A991_9RHOB|nr:HAD family hydrolase [Pontivivens insulae]RED18700.1 putative hydrolase of the HAD superfamily [Pontivivens insulae]SPF28598.1 hypothetical protein POI8812_00900 [Pontivivens insulae]
MILAFDADDTLWHNESVFQMTEARFADLLAPYCEGSNLAQRLAATEKRNLALYGYGVKGFTLSMIETALEVTEQRVPQPLLADLLHLGREMLAHPVDLLPGVEETIESLSASHTLWIITKGDLFDQERKVAASGLGEHFTQVHIVSEKSAGTYRRLFGDRPAMMIGNSPRSDILPALEAGANAVHIPYETTWAHEDAPLPDHPRLHRLPSVTALPELLRETFTKP